MSYLIFAYDQYYPTGGWNDFKEEVFIIEEARMKAMKLALSHDSVQVIDLATLKEIY